MAGGHDDIYDRVQNWISKHDFKEDRDSETGVTWDVSSDLTSITRSLNATTRGAEYAGVKVEQRTDVINCAEAEFRCQSSSNEELAELVKALKQQGNGGAGACPTKKPLSKFNLMKSVSAPPANFSVIVEGEESELPESQKRSDFSFKTIKTSSQANNQTSRPSSRHKRNVADVANVQKPPSSLDRKQRKRRTFERIAGPSVIYSRWFLPLMETLFVGILLLIFDVYVNPEQYREKPTITSFLDQFWTQ